MVYNNDFIIILKDMKYRFLLKISGFHGFEDALPVHMDF